MVENYWRAWEKYLPLEKADKRQPPIKTETQSSCPWHTSVESYWRAWEKYLSPEKGR